MQHVLCRTDTIKYNILKFDKYDIVGNILYYGIIVFIYISFISALYLLYYLVKNKMFNRKNS